MKDVRDLFRAAFTRNAERGHTLLYVAVDAHGTIIRPSKKTVMEIADGGRTPREVVYSYGVTPEFEFYPYAKEVLQRLTDSPHVKMILWTSTQDTYSLIKEFERNGIRVYDLNQNPDFQVTPYADFSKKFYFDVLLDDKAGFDPEADWEKLLAVDFEEFSVGKIVYPGEEESFLDDDD